MIDYELKVEKIIKSIMTFSFEFDFETMKSEMELQEVSKKEIAKLGEEKVREKFNSNLFKIRLPDGNLIDVNSISKYSAKHNIKQPVIFVNPEFKYVQWVLKKDLTTQQIKRHIKKQITNNTDLNLSEVQKALVIADTKNKSAEGYIGELQIKTSSILKEGKFHIQASCTSENAIKMVDEVIEELKVDSINFIKTKIKRDYIKISVYLVFIFVISCLWILSNNFKNLPNWLLSLITFLLFIIPIFVMPLIKHSFFNALFFRKKAERKYEIEFYDKAN